MEEKRTVVFRDGSPGIVRPITSADREAFVEAFESLSEESRFRRFFFNKKILTEADLDQLSTPDGDSHIAYGAAAIDDDGTETPIAVGHCFRNPKATDLAEIAIATADLWQGIGAGNELLISLKNASINAGICQWIAVVLSDNTPMFRLLERTFGVPTHRKEEGNIVEVIYHLEP